MSSAVVMRGGGDRVERYLFLIFEEIQIRIQRLITCYSGVGGGEEVERQVH